MGLYTNQSKQTTYFISNTRATMTNLWKKLFIDIETVGCYDYTSEKEAESFAKTTASKIWIDRYSENNWPERMGLYAEFGKIICVAVGSYDKNNNFVTKAIVNDNERELLVELSHIMGVFDVFVWHNIANFDIPFIIRRMIINGVTVPKTLDFRAKKAYEIPNYIHDTMNLWKFTGWNGNSAGLATIACALWLPDPKAGMDWSEVAAAYRAGKWGGALRELFVDQVSTYCIGDVITSKDIYEKISLAFWL